MNDTVPQLSNVKKKEQPDAFCAWVARQDAGAAGAWVAKLDAAQQKDVAHEMASFCEDAGFDLGWVTQTQVDKETLRTTLETIVLANLQAFYQASEVQPALALYKTTIAWLNAPTSRKYRKQTRAIYKQLADAGVIPPTSADALLDTDKNRWQHVTNALHNAYRTNPSAVEQAVGTVMLTEEESTGRSWWPFNRQPEPVAA